MKKKFINGFRRYLLNKRKTSQVWEFGSQEESRLATYEILQ